MSTEVWLSAAVEKICFFVVGIVVFRSIIGEDAPERLDSQRKR